MMNSEVMNAQPRLCGIIDGSKSYMYEMLWQLCAGPLCDLPKSGEIVYYFPQGHIEFLEKITKEAIESNNLLFDLPAKFRCSVISIELKVEKDTDELYAQLTLFPNTVQAEVPISNDNQQRPKVNFFTKILTESDINTHGGFSVPKKYAIECLPPLDMSQQTPAQELVTKDLHGSEWTFKHIFRGTPQRHLFTTGWSAFVTAKNLIPGDSFVFLRGENGESKVGVRRALQIQRNISSSILSTQSMYHGIMGSAFDAIYNHCMFTVIYKPRLSQFVVSYDKFVDAVNNKFSIGSRFMMLFEGESFAERRYFGTIVGLKDVSPHWKNSEWRNLEVQWDEHASITRPDKVSPWEIQYVEPFSNDSQSYLLKKKRSHPTNETGSTSTNLWNPTLTQGQEIGQSSLSSLLNVPRMIHREAFDDPKSHCGNLMSYISPIMSRPNYNNEIIIPTNKKIITDATTSCRLFGVELTTPTKINDPMRLTDSFQISDIPKISDEKLNATQTLTSSKEVQSNQITYTRNCTKVKMEGVAIGRVVNLNIFDGYNQLIDELEKSFNLEGGLRTRDQWDIVFIDNEGDMMVFGDNSWPEFCNMVKQICICSKDNVMKMNSRNISSGGESIFQEQQS